MNVFARKIIICVFVSFLIAWSFVSAREKISKDILFTSKIVSVDSLQSKESIKFTKFNQCGDGVIDVNGIDEIFGTFDDEQCDDGNTVSGDGCSFVCKSEQLECVELEDINFDLNQDGNSDIWDIITARSTILWIAPIYNDGSCGDRFIPVTRWGTVLWAEWICCPIWSICDLNCNGILTVSDIQIMSQLILWTFDWEICGQEVCEESEEWSVIVTPIELTNVFAQVCSDNVDVNKFTIENDGNTDLLVDTAKFQAYVDTGSFNIADYVETARLRVRTDAWYQILDIISSADFMWQMMIFDDFSYSIPVWSTVEFLVTVDARQELGAMWLPPLRIDLVWANIETIWWVSVCEINQLWCAEADSMRVVSFTPNATLEVSVDLDDSLVDRNKYILAWDEIDNVPFVAAFDLIAEFGAVDVEDIILNVYWDVEGLRNVMDEVVLYDNDFNIIASEVSFEWNSDFISFDNVGYEVEEGVSTMYVKVSWDLTGNDENWLVTDDIQVSLWMGNNTEIINCEDQVDVIYDWIWQTLLSHEFAIVPVTFANYEFVTSTPLEEYEVDFFVTNGVNEVFAILEVTASERENTSVIDWSDIEILIDSIWFSNINPQYNSNTRTIRLWSSNTLEPIKSWETAYFILLWDVSIPDWESTIMAVEYDAVNNPIEYRVSDGTFFSSETRLGIWNISAPEITLLWD